MVDSATFKCTMVPFETKEGKTGTCCFKLDKGFTSNNFTATIKTTTSKTISKPSTVHERSTENTVNRKIIVGRPQCLNGQTYDSITQECVDEFEK